MKSHEPKHTSTARFLNLNLSLTLNPFVPESKIKMKTKIKRRNECKHPSAASARLTRQRTSFIVATVEWI